jgi:hypothetical protein
MNRVIRLKGWKVSLMDFGCGCLGITVVAGFLLIIAGLMDTFAKGRPDIGVPIIGAGVGTLLIAYFILARSSEKDVKRRIKNNAGSSIRPRVDSQGRFYCNACGGYVSRHDPSNHPESN